MKKQMQFKTIFSVGLMALFVFTGLVVFGQQPAADAVRQAADLGSGSHFFDFQLSNFDRGFFIRLGVNLLTMIVLVRFIYFKVYGRREFFFTFFMFNLVIFIITFLLNSNSGFSIGAAFGLFAIFSMLRYRTEDISTRDMTYLFLSITIGLISSINMGTLVELLTINVIIVLGAYLLEGNILVKPEFFKTLEYEKIELITPDKRKELIDDLKLRTGLDVHKVYIKRIDFLRDTATIKIYYFNEKNHEV